SFVHTSDGLSIAAASYASSHARGVAGNASGAGACELSFPHASNAASPKTTAVATQPRIRHHRPNSPGAAAAPPGGLAGVMGAASLPPALPLVPGRQPA